jgi:membrane-bound lytic murein transglycosylase MltF
MTGHTTLRRNHTPLALCMIALTVWALSSVTAHGQTKTRPLPSAPPVPAKPAAVSVVAQKWTGDFDGMVQRRRIRILTPYSRTHYFIDKGVQRGIVYDAGVKLETEINKTLKTTPATKVHVVFLPTSRDDLQRALIEGQGDIVAANVTVTAERAKIVDFATPGKTGVQEIVVTGPGAAALTTLDDLGGKDVYVREQSIQFQSLSALNATLKQQGKLQVAIKTVPPSLEDEDILEMVNAGLLKATVVDDFMGQFWKLILPNLTLHENLSVRDEGSIAWVARKGSPKLLAVLNPFIDANKAGTLFGNSLLQTYLKNAKFVKSATSGSDLARFQSLIEMFKKYSGQYSVDYLLMMAQGYQESGLNQSVKSPVGAIGVMQVMPATGQGLKVGNINDVDANIHAGVKYIRFMIDEQFAGDPADDLNKGLFAFAAYNCGPGRLRQLRKETESKGLNPNVWFNNVERTAGERVGRETVQYVSNIYKYYVAYTLVLQQLQEKDRAKQTIKDR